MVGLAGCSQELFPAVVSPLAPIPSSPFCADLSFPLPRGLAFPPCARPPAAAPTSSPLCARRCRAATLTLAPLRVARDTRCPRSFHAPSLPPPRGALRHSGHRPGSGHSPAACAAGRGLRTGLGTSPPSSRHTSWSGSTAGLRVELARLRSLASASAKGLGEKIGGVLRGVLPRSLGRLRRLRPAGFGWGRASSLQ